MVKNLFWFGVVCMLLVLSGCANQPSYPPYPILTSISVSKTAINFSPSTGYTLDSVTITAAFTDGEGGIGPIDPGGTDTVPPQAICNHAYDSSILNSPVYNLYYYEYQQGPDSCLGEYPTASVPDNAKNHSLSGTVQFFPIVECPGSGSSDTIYFSVFIKDRYGKFSNRLRTPGIVITCN